MRISCARAVVKKKGGVTEAILTTSTNKRERWCQITSRTPSGKSLYVILVSEHLTFRILPLCLSPGYANELGEAFRHIVSVKLVYLSYFVSSAYVLSHSIFNGVAAGKNQAVASKRNLDTSSVSSTLSGEHRNLMHVKLTSPSSKAFVDTLIWQGLASVIIPGLVINRTCAVSRLALRHFFRGSTSETARKVAVTGIGIGSIPCIIHPIDRCVAKLSSLSKSGYLLTWSIYLCLKESL